MFLLLLSLPRTKSRGSLRLSGTSLGDHHIADLSSQMFRPLFSANRDKHLQDDNDEIVLIPDLDEDGGADADQRSNVKTVLGFGDEITSTFPLDSCTCSAECQSPDTNLKRS